MSAVIIHFAILISWIALGINHAIKMEPGTFDIPIGIWIMNGIVIVLLECGHGIGIL